MQIVLNILKKTSELAELKNLIILKNSVISEKNQYSVKDNKHFLDTYKYPAMIQKKKIYYQLEVNLLQIKLKKLLINIISKYNKIR